MAVLAVEECLRDDLRPCWIARNSYPAVAARTGGEFRPVPIAAYSESSANTVGGKLQCRIVIHKDVLGSDLVVELSYWSTRRSYQFRAAVGPCTSRLESFDVHDTSTANAELTLQSTPLAV